MTSINRWCLLPLAAFLLLSIVPTVTEVVNSMSDCAEFLLERNPPQIPGILEGGNILNQNRYKPICQTFEDKRRFVTLYDTENKIPVFSAYKYRGHGGGNRPRADWMIEPQLEETSDDKNMMRNNKNTVTNQASFDDYKNKIGYNKGHLFPVCHAFDQSDKKSTFTLTNIVPQAISFNNGSWQKMENCIKCVLQKYCINNNNVNEGFVVTGAHPSMDNKLNNTINIPSILWSAFCCYSKENNQWLASAHWGDNIQETETTYLQTKTLAELSQKLGSGFEAFPGTNCSNTTVAEFYPEMNKNCQCPPQASTTSAPPTTTKITDTTYTTITTSDTISNTSPHSSTIAATTVTPIATSRPTVTPTDTTISSQTTQTSTATIPTTLETQTYTTTHGQTSMATTPSTDSNEC